jgi:aminopeptidase N
MDSGSVLADAALERFHAMFRNDPAGARQVVRAAGRRAEHEGKVFEQVPAPARPPGLQLANPNRARSLIGTFCLRQPGGLSIAPTAPATPSGPTG